MKKEKLYKLLECSIMIALATVLSFCKLYRAPLGGSVTLLSMLPIIFISFRHGPVWGTATGFVYSIIQLILGLDSVGYVPTALGVVGCVLFDFIVPYTVIGLAGLTMYLKPKTKRGIMACIVGGTLAVLLMRFASHFIFGAVVWYGITKAGEWNDAVFKYGMWMYSFVYNISYLGPDFALVLLASPVIYKLKDLRIGRAKTDSGRS